MFYVVTLTHEILLHPEHFGADLQVLPTLCQTAQALLPIFVFATLGRVAVRLAVGGERGVQGRALNGARVALPWPQCAPLATIWNSGSLCERSTFLQVLCCEGRNA